MDENLIAHKHQDTLPPPRTAAPCPHPPSPCCRPWWAPHPYRRYTVTKHPRSSQELAIRQLFEQTSSRFLSHACPRANHLICLKHACLRTLARPPLLHLPCSAANNAHFMERWRPRPGSPAPAGTAWSCCGSTSHIHGDQAGVLRHYWPLPPCPHLPESLCLSLRPRSLYLSRDLSRSLSLLLCFFLLLRSSSSSSERSYLHACVCACHEGRCCKRSCASRCILHHICKLHTEWTWIHSHALITPMPLSSAQRKPSSQAQVTPQRYSARACNP